MRPGEARVALDGGTGIVVRDDGRFETAVIANILGRLDDGFRAQPIPDRVSTRPILADLGIWTGTLRGVAPIGFDLPN